MELPVSLYLGFLLPILLLLYKLMRTPLYKFPPGPKGWPIVGNIFDVTMGAEYLDFTRLSKQHGDITCVDMAGQKIVVLSSTDAIREAFVSEDMRDAFAGRPDTFYTRYCDSGPSTSFRDFDDVWRTQRQFLTRTLKLYDNDRHHIEQVISEHISVALSNIKDKNGEPFDLKTTLVPSLANILVTLICGKRYNLDDPALKAAIEYEEIEVRFIMSKEMSILELFPFLRHLFIGCGKLYQEYIRRREKYFYYLFEKNKKTFNPSVTRGYIDDLFRQQMENTPWPKDDHIKGLLRETTGAGISTTSSTLSGFFLYILYKPEVMRKIQGEIDAVIGRDRDPMLRDRSHMAYTEAVVLEVMRYISSAPIGFKTTTRDVKFRGYFLPKDTWVFGNYWCVHHDPAIWGDPWEFRPERFLDGDGKLLSLDSQERRNWMPFGVGRRSCVGENFARFRIFLIITRLLQNLDFLPCEEEPFPSPDPRGYKPAVILGPPAYKLRAVPR